MIRKGSIISIRLIIKVFMKTKAEQIEKEEKTIKSITNLKIYEKNVFKRELVLGFKIGTAMSVISLSLAIINEVWGIKLQIDDTNFIGDFINTIYQNLSTPSLSKCTAGFVGSLSGACINAIYSIKILEKQKYFIDNKEEITRALGNITILDVKKLSKNQLKESTEHEKSRVLK